MTVQQILNKQPLLLYDGDCAFCNGMVSFFLRNERRRHGKGVMHFSSLQSDVAATIRNYFSIGDSVDSIILVKDHACYIKSCAALRLTLYMKGLWPLLSIFIIIPPFIRNIFYDAIARRRKRLRKGPATCDMPDADARERFITT